MLKQFMPEETPEERKRLLLDNADKVERTDYIKPLTPEEIDLKRELHTDNAIKLSEIEEEKKEAMADFKARIDPIATENKMLLQQIKTRQEEVSGTLYTFFNIDERTATVYDENGECVLSRRMRPDENQTTILSMSKKAQ